MKKEELFFDAITGVREDLIESALEYRFRRRNHWGRYAALAACLALVLLVGQLFPAFIGGVENTSEGAADTVTGFNTAAGGDEDSGMSIESKDTEMPSRESSEQSAANNSPTATAEEDSALSGGSQGSAGAERESDEYAVVPYHLTAVVLEIYSTYLLVEPAEEEQAFIGADRVEVPISGLTLPELEVGSRVVIGYVGDVLEVYPVRLTDVVSLELLP